MPVIARVLRDWDRLTAGDEDLQWLERPLRDCGLPVESFAVQARLARLRPDDVVPWERLVGSVLESGDRWWARELLDEASVSSRHLDAAAVQVRIDVGEGSAAVDEWLARYSDSEAIEAALPWLLECGRLGDAERLIGATAGLDSWRARLALWRGDAERARSITRKADVAGRDQAALFLAVADVLEGRVDEAEPALRRLCHGAARAEAWSWLATILRKRGDYSGAIAAADASARATPRFCLAARLEREIASEYESLVDGREPKPRTIGELEHVDTLLSCFQLDPSDSMFVLEELIERFAGNRSPFVTTVEAGDIVLHTLPLDPRHLGAVIQEVLWTRGPAAVRRLYRQEAARVAEHPLYRIYEGELELWMGEYEAAAEIFRDILEYDASVKWAWIGLGACHLFEGRFDPAQATWREGAERSGQPGPTLYAYRGECYRRQGQADSARADLEHALEQRPSRLSAKINLALLNAAPGDLDAVVEECERRAPSLMAELPGDAAERLEQVLLAMRGNRSSTPGLISYHLRGRLWRLIE